MTDTPAREVRIGVLGAARIVRDALVKPAGGVEGLHVSAIAARDPERAAAFAEKHRIPRVHKSYSALLADPEIDAVYVALPAALHEKWTVAAIRAGKHVLCEKPFTSNAEAAERVAAVAAAGPVAVVEAYHSHYHPLRARLHEILDSGELGRIESASAGFCVSIPPGDDIRWNLALGGGALLDIGYYPLRLLRELFGEIDGVDATARTRGQIDRRIDARLTHAGGVESTMLSSMWSLPLLAMQLHIQGSEGQLRVGTPYHPHQGGRLRIKTAEGLRVEKYDRKSTYHFQLEAFRDAVRGAPVQTGPAEAVSQLRAIDAVYQAAGLLPRP